jgi:2-polyprenyl-6-methoxyphenol hydroxylase-like FAD-dependent oxidoreductase
VLFRNAAERGATSAFNTDYVSHTQDEHGVTVELADNITGRRYSMRARYLVGADGARSKVADDIGLQIDGEMARAATAYVLFRADLSRYVEHRPSILHWILTPGESSARSAWPAARHPTLAHVDRRLGIQHGRRGTRLRPRRCAGQDPYPRR